MQEAQANVRAFCEAFGQAVASRPTLPSVPDQRLRLDLIREETDELDAAFLEGDLVKVADAIGDLLYVVLGAAVASGLEMEPIFYEIHRSNMTKVGGHKAENGKWIKPATYSPARVAVLVTEQEQRA